MSNFIFSVIVFYIALLVMLSGIGLSVGNTESALSFPTIPSFPDFNNLGIFQAAFGLISFVLAFGAWIALVFGFLFQLLAFTFVDVIGFPLNVLIFLPLVLFTTYEIVARLVRGS